MKRHCAYVLGLFSLLTWPALGQGMIGFSGGGGGTRDGGFQGNATFRLPLPTPPVLVNAPYSGEQVNETSQTLADGTNISRRMGLGGKTWRDSQGRVRMERPLVNGPTTLKNAPTLVQITDPVAGYTYIMDNVTRVAHRIVLAAGQRQPAMARMANPAAMAAGRGAVGAPPSNPGGVPLTGVTGYLGGGGGGRSAGAGQPQPNPAARGDVARPQMSSEDLGTQTIDGVLVYGTRTTTIIPIGMRGNDRPITTTRETWISPELQLTVLTTNFSPASGTSTNKIANLSRSEPDPALFFVPADYTIVDEKDTFTIKWGEQ